MPEVPEATFVTNQGSFTVKLMPDHAPKTVQNFIDLATGNRSWTDPRDGQSKSEALYPGTIFHRVIDGFMIQDTPSRTRYPPTVPRSIDPACSRWPTPGPARTGASSS